MNARITWTLIEPRLVGIIDPLCNPNIGYDTRELHCVGGNWDEVSPIIHVDGKEVKPTLCLFASLTTNYLEINIILYPLNRNQPCIHKSFS